jgi:hypothetical protein
MTITFHFRFKGQRNYVHGSDIFNALEVEFRPDGKHVSVLSFRHFAQNQLQAHFEKPGDSEGVVVEGQLRESAGREIPFWLTQTGEAVKDRYPFDEDAITGPAMIDGDTITAPGLAEFSVIEQVIALTKALNYAKSPDVSGKWVFGQLKLQQALPEAASRYLIRQKSLLANRFSVQTVVLDDIPVGEIRFIVGTP